MSVSYHGIRLTSPRSFPAPFRACAPVFILLLALILGGCTYVCHTYQISPPDPEKKTIPAVGSIGDFKVYLDVHRWRGETSPHPPRGGWPHWPASGDDVYWIDVEPSAGDSTAWEGIGVEIPAVTLVFGDKTLTIEWDDVEDARVDTLVGYQDSYVQHRRSHAPLRFISTAFQLPVPVPDTLEFTFEIRVIDTATGRELHRKTIRARAVVERHRRWGIADAFES